MRAVLAPMALVALFSVAGCATGPEVGGTARTAERASLGEQDDGPGAAALQGDAESRKLIGQDVATRHALFKVSAFDSLPGWRQDNLGEAWAAFRESCRALERKPNWKPLCAQVKAIKDPKAGRLFLEKEFALLVVQNTDRSREGDITGYYEPLLQGRAQREARFSVPVYGVPNDLYILDWKNVPAGQRKGLAYVRANGRLLTSAQAGQPGAVKIDVRRFTPDTLDRRLRVRIQRGPQGDEAVPYPSRADIGRQAALDAPVLAWVEDPVALYAMQVQGAGRIRLADGTVLRLQYADQNGHPFRPMQLAAQGNERVQTRGAGDPGSDIGDSDIEHFELAGAAGAVGADAADSAPEGDLVTRGTRLPAGAADGDVAATVDALTPKTATPRPASIGAPVSGPRVVKGTVIAITGGTRPAAAPSTSNQVVDDLLTQAKQGGVKPVAKPVSPGSLAVAQVAQVTQATQRQRALESDPSYVFFRVAPDQAGDAGPVGALGVPLTAGRSLAVDPRVLPLGYPVFLDAATSAKRETHLQRLMFAQDTGGAIRGAVRADYFWGFGADAGKQARRTKQKGRLWVMVPHAEVQALLSSKLVTRGPGGAMLADRDCLVEDPEFCQATDED
jgi:membrane-bound lytic murein transglycosylase A